MCPFTSTICAESCSFTSTSVAIVVLLETFRSGESNFKTFCYLGKFRLLPVQKFAAIFSRACPRKNWCSKYSDDRRPRPNAYWLAPNQCDSWRGLSNLQAQDCNHDHGRAYNRRTRASFLSQ